MKEHRKFLYTCTAEFYYLSSVSKIFMDGTFKSSPNLFYQIYTIHGYFRDTQTCPFGLCILPNREENIWKMFQSYSWKSKYNVSRGQ